MSSDQISPNQLFDQAVTEFEHGNYQAAIAKLEQAKQSVNLLSQLGGEIQIWLANAYEAVGRNSEAITLCEQLKIHPERQVRKSAAFVLEIISAPSLSELPDGKLQIPDLSKDPANSDFGYRSLNLSEKTKQDRPPEQLKLETRTTKFIRADQLALIVGIAIALIWLGLML